MMMTMVMMMMIKDRQRYETLLCFTDCGGASKGHNQTVSRNHNM